MAVQDANLIDIVAHNPKTDEVMLVMVETREWDDSGAFLRDLQAKLNTYLAYALDGRLICDYPAYASKPIRIELRSLHPLSSQEEQFLDIVAVEDLRPRGVTFSWRLID